METSAFMENRLRGPRWAWPAWLALVALLGAGLVLWFVALGAYDAPGPLIAGVFIDGPIEVSLLVIYVVTSAVLSTISTALIYRAPENRIGWVLWLMATWTVLTFFVTMALFAWGPPGSWTWELANWLGEWTFAIAAPTSLALLIFPTGRWISPSWRWIGFMAVTGTIGWAVSEATAPGLGLSNEISNPFTNLTLYRIGRFLVLALLPALAGTVWSLFLRFRLANPVERLQVKWVMFGGVLQVGAIGATWIVDTVSPSDFPIQAVVVALVASLFVPISLTVAILRFRLYSIDHVISRTASYLLLTSLLTGLFTAGAIAAQSLFAITDSLSVALTTLAVAAAFNPIRQRLHTAMDKRFNRRRFDAQNEADSFADRVSSTTAIDSLLAELETTVERTMAPNVIGVWVRQ